MREGAGSLGGRESALLAGWIAWGAAALWIQRLPAETLADLLPRIYPPLLAVELLALVSLAVLELPAIVRATRASRGALAVVAAASLLALTLTAWLAPPATRIFFDEQIYTDVAHNIADSGRAHLCNDGTIVDRRLVCAEAGYNKEPPGFPFLISVAGRFIGFDERAAFLVNIAATALVPWAVFIAAALLLNDPAAGAWAAIVAAVLPEPLRWGHTGAAEPTAALFTAAAVAAAAAFTVRRTSRGLALAVAAAATAAQMRPESVLVVALAAAMVWFLAPDEVPRMRLSVAALALFAVSLPLIGHFAMVGGHSWDAPGARFSPAHLLTNVPVNAPFYFADARFPAAAGLLALLGAAAHPSRRGRAVAVAYALLFWIVFAFFYAGSYDFGANVRYSLLTTPAVAVLAGGGITTAIAFGARLGVPRLVTGAALAAVLLVHFGFAVPLIRRVGDEGWPARADVAFARRAVQALPPRSFVVTHVPGMFLNWGQSAAQTASAARPGYVEARGREFPGGVYLHWGYWCDASVPAQHAICTAVRDRHSGVEVATAAGGMYRYALYRLDAAGSTR
jgi:hypothetical protein